MSISSALATAASGLAATTRATEVVASNVANAATPGYARRSVSLAATPDGGGVRVVSIDRMVSSSILADRRVATASAARADTTAAYFVSMESALGLNPEGQSLVDRVASLEATLVAATSRPEDPLSLDAVVNSSVDLVGAINGAAKAVTDARNAAEAAISHDVATLDSALRDVARLNRSVIIEQANGRDASSLMDERQRIIDSISSIVAIREIPRENGRVALFTQGGAVLLDGVEPIDLSFSSSGALSPAMQVGTPPVERLTVNGEELSERMMGLFGGGSLEAQFRIRDELAPQLQQQLDSFAFELADRFADPGLDPSIAAGQPGLFTDSGAAADPAARLGLANRLTVNAAITQPGESWHLRDGLGAPVPGPEGNSSLLAALAGRFADFRAPAAPGFGAASYNVATLAAELGARVSTARISSQEASARETAREDALQSGLLADGVDTDAEMQRLLELELAYAANAKVIAAADAMISRLLEI